MSVSHRHAIGRLSPEPAGLPVQEDVMRVLVVGGTGAVGRPLLPKLVDAGHELVATARDVPDLAPPDVSFRPLDLLDGASGPALLESVRPEAVIHQATALTGLGNNLRRCDASFAATNRPSTVGTRSLIEAATALPTTPRLVVQSFCGWPWAPEGGPIKTEEDRLDPNPAPGFRRTFPALVQLENLVCAFPREVRCGTARSMAPGHPSVSEASRSR